MNYKLLSKAIVLIAPLLYAEKIVAQKGLPPGKDVSASVNTSFPEHIDFSESLLKNLKVPQGFKVAIAATSLGKPRMMAISDDGTLYVTRRDAGDILMLKDLDNDGRYETLKTAWGNFADVHGIAIHDGMLYGCSSTHLKRAKINPDGSLTDTVTLLKDLPEGAQHNNRVIAFGADGKLYMTVGSSCNDCGETNPEHATMLVMNANGSDRRIFARGLRNTIGFDWQPQTKQIWGCDNGTDWRGDEIPPEELNQISEGKNYGWPQVFGKQQPDYTREEPPGQSLAEFAKTTEPSVMEFPAHSAPIDFRFMTAAKTFPKDYQDDALVCWHGSWNRKNPEGYKVQRIIFENGRPTKVEDFFSGFLSADGKSRFGRPAGLVFAKNGTLFISDDENGVIYSVTHP
ncbi:glucose dehydrogenase [Pedobacter sp. HMF7647]|uniref:Glucose dehydrogenase n=1 Tax=Hufsiella arboris TaxID=2695275 RepID=A0A7K1YCT6_9SPHI|nr:PQQ-dependent sugar dehydrogenase [Hufsiella arboris]MXV52393.1 glucose dehydrogenase [Hufsiella arboris]